MSEPAGSVGTRAAWDAATVRDDHAHRFGAAFDAAAIGMATMTVSGQIARVNAALAEFFKTAPLVFNSRFDERLIPADVTRFQDALRKVTTNAEPACAVTVSIDGIRPIRNVLAVITPVRDGPASHVDYVLIQVIDRSIQQGAEEEARLLLETARALAGNSSRDAGGAFVARQLSEAIGADVVAVWFSDPERNDPVAQAPPGRSVSKALHQLAVNAWIDGVDLWSADPSSAGDSAIHVRTASVTSHEQKPCAVVAAEFSTDSETGQIQRLLTGVTAQLGPWAAQITATSALRLSEERHRTLVEGATDAIIGSDSSGRILVWNDAASAMFGYKREAIVGKPVATVIPLRFKSRHEQAFSAAIAASGPRRTVVRATGLHADGHEFPVEAAVSTSGSGSDALAFAIIRDVGKQLEMLSRFQENERRLREAEHVAHMGSFEWEVGTDKIHWSEELYRIYGLKPNEFPGTYTALMDRIHPDDREALNKRVQRALETGGGWSVDERIVRADNAEVRTLSTTGEAVADASGKVIRLCGICYDVTEQRRAEQALRQSEERFRLLVQGVRDYAIVMLDVDGRVETWNDGAAQVTGYTADRALGRRLQQFFPLEDQRTEKASALLHAAAENGSAETEGWQVRENGTRYWALTLITRLVQEERAVGYALLTRDMSERRAVEAALEASELRFRHGFEHAPIGMLLLRLTDEDAAITRTNNALSYLLGYSTAELTSMRLSQLVEAEDWRVLREMLSRVSHPGSAAAHVEVRMHGNNSRVPIVVAAASRIETDSEEPTIILHVEDITERKHAEEQLRHRALHDALTGLPNRDLLLDRLAGALVRAERANASVAVFFLDLDNFKLINDTIGHVAGDEMLRTIANRLIAVGRSGDTSARVGGDEFVMVCENVVREDEILSLAHRVSDALSSPITIGGSDFTATVSVGVALGRAHTHSPEQLLRDADLAMYRAKQRGKSAIELFDEALRRHAVDRVEVERQLRIGLRNNEVVPYYQAIVALDTGQLAGFEALARWNHPDRGLLAPADFLSVAEESNLIGILGAQILRAACQQLATWQATAPDLIMAVNLSLRQLDGRFAEMLAGTIEDARILASALHLEVTESVLLDIHRSAGTDLNAIAKCGVQLGIDDFGTGYSSLVYLKRFPVRFLKIDRSFVDGIPDDPEDLAIVGAIVRLGQSLGLCSIAEGVENVEQLATLRRLGCGFAQGMLLAPPFAAKECAELLTAGRRW